MQKKEFVHQGEVKIPKHQALVFLKDKYEFCLVPPSNKDLIAF